MKRRKMFTVKIKFNFEGIKHDARMDLFPEYQDKEDAFIEFFRTQLIIATLKKK